MPDRVCYTPRLLEESKQRGLALVNWAPFYPSVKDLELDIRKQLDLQSFPLPRSVGIKQKKFRANVVTAIAEELLASRRTALNPAKLSAFPGTQVSGAMVKEEQREEMQVDHIPSYEPAARAPNFFTGTSLPTTDWDKISSLIDDTKELLDHVRRGTEDRSPAAQHLLLISSLAASEVAVAAIAIANAGLLAAPQPGGSFVHHSRPGQANVPGVSGVASQPTRGSLIHPDRIAQVGTSVDSSSFSVQPKTVRYRSAPALHTPSVSSVAVEDEDMEEGEIIIGGDDGPDASSPRSALIHAERSGFVNVADLGKLDDRKSREPFIHPERFAQVETASGNRNDIHSSVIPQPIGAFTHPERNQTIPVKTEDEDGNESIVQDSVAMVQPRPTRLIFSAAPEPVPLFAEGIDLGDRTTFLKLTQSFEEANIERSPRTICGWLRRHLPLAKPAQIKDLEKKVTAYLANPDVKVEARREQLGMTGDGKRPHSPEPTQDATLKTEDHHESKRRAIAVISNLIQTSTKESADKEEQHGTKGIKISEITRRPVWMDRPEKIIVKTDDDHYDTRIAIPSKVEQPQMNTQNVRLTRSASVPL